jgi:S1-C subfamily serine protease
MDSRILSRAAGLTAAAVLGAGLALGGAAALGGFDSHTTTVREIVSGSGGSAAPAAFKQGPLSINEIYRRAAPGVVQVTSTSVVSLNASDPFGFPIPGFEQQETQRALGSGFVIDKAGHIVTNYHVVQGARSVEVSFSNRDSMKARIVGTDPSTDIAVLKVDAPSSALTPLPLASPSNVVRVGDSVVAIGNPFGLERSVSAGIVSALQRQIQAPNAYSIDHVIQTDAAINHGNSGGPLLNARGEVIGVNSQIETGSSDPNGGNVGVGFAIPVNTVRDVAAQIIRTGKVEHAFLGIAGQGIDKQVADLFHLPVSRGVLVARVTPGSGAAKAGLRGGSAQAVVSGESYQLGGDLIVKADGVTIGSLARLRDVIAQKKPGDTLKLEVYRGTKKMTIDVELGRLPSSPRS